MNDRTVISTIELGGTTGETSKLVLQYNYPSDMAESGRRAIAYQIAKAVEEALLLV